MILPAVSGSDGLETGNRKEKKETTSALNETLHTIRILLEKELVLRKIVKTRLQALGRILLLVNVQLKTNLLHGAIRRIILTCSETHWMSLKPTEKKMKRGVKSMRTS